MEESSQENHEVQLISMSGVVTDPRLELLDPIPDIYALFQMFDIRFFNRTLSQHAVTLSWSPRMTTTAGLCRWSPRSGLCEIRLSQPLLKLRPRKDLVETLIHEMIHALLFVTHEDDNHESHGQQFHFNMYRINREGGCHITVYHNFHDEVKHYKKHVWRCTGPCRERQPYFGYVSRACNRPPQPHDFWWSKHAASCDGKFVKIEGPEKNDKTKEKKGKTDVKEKSGVQDIRTFFSSGSSSSTFPGEGQVLGSSDDTVHVIEVVELD